jgi:transcriptional regulator with XRE-family HTH domain
VSVEPRVTSLSVGNRIRLCRERRGKSREALAGLANVSPSWLKAVENGTRKADSLRMLMAIAEALDVEVWDLIPGPRRLAPNAGAVSDGVVRIQGALVANYGRRAGDASEELVPHLARLRREMDAAWELRSACQFDAVGARLAILIPEAERAVHVLAHEQGHEDALRLRAETCWAAAYTLFRAGDRGTMAWLAADRFVETARQVGDPLLVALGSRCVAHVLTYAGRSDDALAVARAAIDILEPAMGDASVERLSVWGSLHLAAALAAATSDQRAACQGALHEAERASARLPSSAAPSPDRQTLTESALRHVGFTAANVAIHGVSASVDLGDGGEALRLSDQVDLDDLPDRMRGRRAQLHLDVARVYEQRRQHDAAVHRLHEAERFAPELVRYSPDVREMCRAMLRRSRGRSIPSLIDLARRVGALADQ